MSKEINKVIMHLKYLHDVQSWGICESEQDTMDRRKITKEAIDFLKAQEPIEARLHLCESCKKQYPDCEATKDGIVFGNGIGNDNIIGCTAYDNRWMSQNEPRVLAIDEIHSGMTVWLEDEDKTEVILAIVVVPDGICRCFITTDNRRISPSNNDYCVRWRAWTSEPTDVQRKAVKWNG